MRAQIQEILAEIRWLGENSDGIAGLRLDGGVMPWQEVLDLYCPTIRKAVTPDHSDGSNRGEAEPS